MDSEHLIAELVRLNQTIAELTEQQGRIEMELVRIMINAGATSIPHPTHQVVLKTTLSYDPSRLHALRELIDPQELEDAGAYIPAHQQTVNVPEKWNLTHLKKFQKYGADVRKVIENAAYVQASKLTIKEKI